MLPLAEGELLSLQQDAVRWPNELRQAAAVCNALTLISKSQIAGELGERQAFDRVEARFLVCAHLHVLFVLIVISLPE